MRRSERFPASPRSVLAARRFAVSALPGVAPRVAEAVALMVSELATNCIRHAGAGFELVVEHAQDEIRVEVTDSAPGAPTMRSPAPDEMSGRGLSIVDMLSDRWGVRHAIGTGKTVWFTMPAAAAGVLATPKAGRARKATDRPTSERGPSRKLPPSTFTRIAAPAIG